MVQTLPGGIFLLICVLAITVPIPKLHEVKAEPSEPLGAEVTKKPKAAVPSANKRPKKETKKKWWKWRSQAGLAGSPSRNRHPVSFLHPRLRVWGG